MQERIKIKAVQASPNPLSELDPQLAEQARGIFNQGVRVAADHHRVYLPGMTGGVKVSPEFRQGMLQIVAHLQKIVPLPRRT